MIGNFINQIAEQKTRTTPDINRYCKGGIWNIPMTEEGIRRREKLESSLQVSSYEQMEKIFKAKLEQIPEYSVDLDFYSIRFDLYTIEKIQQIHKAYYKTKKELAASKGAK